MQIIIVESAEALAEQIEKALNDSQVCYDGKAINIILSSLHPIDVPSDAVEFAQTIKDECFDPWEMDRDAKLYQGTFDTPRAAALIAAYGRQVPREMLQEAHILGRDDDYYDRHFEHKNIAAIATKYGYHAE